MKGVLVQLERTWINLTTREEIYRTLVVLHLYILIIADEEACLRQLEDVLYIANGTGQLACGCIFDRFICDRGTLDLLGNTTFTQRVSTIENSRQVGRNVSTWISLCED